MVIYNILKIEGLEEIDYLLFGDYCKLADKYFIKGKLK